MVQFENLRTRLSPLALVPMIMACAGCGEPADVAGPQVPIPPGANVAVDGGQTYQTMRGWEATLSGGWTMPASARAALIAEAVNDFGVTRVRLEATSNQLESPTPLTDADCGSAAITGANDNADPATVRAAGWQWHCFDRMVRQWVLPLKQATEARGEPFHLNVTYVGFNNSVRFQQTNPAEYAEFVAVVLDHLKTTHNLEPDTWEALLEADLVSTVDGAQLGRLIAAAGARIRAAGFTKVMFTAPSPTNPNNTMAYLNGLLSVAGASAYLQEIAYHRYSDPQPGALATIRDAATARGWRTAMLEHIGADVHELYDDVTGANVSSWARFALAGPHGGPNGGSQLYHVDVTNGAYQIKSHAYPLRQYYKYIRPGAVRLGASATTASIKPVAFRNPGNKYVVVANTTGSATLQVGGLPAGTYDVSYTTGSQLGVTAAAVTIASGALATATIPAAGTITLSQR